MAEIVSKRLGRLHAAKVYRKGRYWVSEGPPAWIFSFPSKEEAIRNAAARLKLYEDERLGCERTLEEAGR